MANLINFDTESGANYIGDDSEPSITIQNSSTGRALDLKGAAAAALRAKSTGAANSTVTSAIEFVGTSVASGSLIALLNKSAFVSTATIDIELADQVAGAIRVVMPNGTFGWIPVLNDAQVTAVAL